jgi:hypothetical protein
MGQHRHSIGHLTIVLARRFPGSVGVMAAVLAISAAVAMLTWQSWTDAPSIIAMAMDTVGMFLFRGIPMRIYLGLAALACIGQLRRRGARRVAGVDHQRGYHLPPGQGEAAIIYVSSRAG